MSDDDIRDDEPQTVNSDIGPFAIIPQWVRKALTTGKIDGTALAVYCVLAERADRGGERHDYRSVATIAEELGVDPGTVRRALNKLRDAGAVSWTQRQRPDGSKSTNDYHLHFIEPSRMGEPTIAHPRADYNDRAPTRDGTAHPRARVVIPNITPTSSQINNVATRPRDLIFDAIADICGVEQPVTKGMGGQIAKAKKEIVGACYGYSPEAMVNEIKTRATRYMRQMPAARLTPTALSKHWSGLGERSELVQSESRRNGFARATRTRSGNTYDALFESGQS